MFKLAFPFYSLIVPAQIGMVTKCDATGWQKIMMLFSLLSRQVMFTIRAGQSGAKTSDYIQYNTIDKDGLYVNHLRTALVVFFCDNHKCL